ncbi:MAG: hypothetical protein OEY38_02860 [Gammaproteobacteria bacterium]|nr:hypothetical protein [Gammaproteobacteria bacterium]
MSNEFLKAFQGKFIGILSWQQWDEFRQQLINTASADWYIHRVGEPIPEHTISEIQFIHFLEQIDRLFHEKHQARVFGLVYTDDLQQPTLIKLYHPKNLGATCGSSGSRVLPGWVLSHLKPVDLSVLVVEEKRKPWWKFW